MEERGKPVFFAPASYNPVFFSAPNLCDPKFFKAAGIPVANEGGVPFASWVIQKKGTVELGSMDCNTLCNLELGYKTYRQPVEVFLCSAPSPS